MKVRPRVVSFCVADLLKTSTPSCHVGDVSFLEYPGNRDVCVVPTLGAYLRRSAAVRGSTTSLLITSTPPYRAASRDTIIRWTRDVMKGAGIDVSRFRPYSVKAAGVSKAARSLSLKSIMSAVGWRRESTYRTFYDMPVSSQGSFGAAVLANV